MINFVLTATTGGTAAGPMGGYAGLIWIIALVAMMGFMMISQSKAQKKEQAAKAQMLADLAVGDCVLTSSGFYGIIIDISDDTVIVEFGNNKNCRIPMEKTAISKVEKAEN